MKSQSIMTRRRFLALGAVLALFVGLGVSPLRSKVLDKIVKWRWPGLDWHAPVGDLSVEESATVAALASVLVPGNYPFLMDHVARKTTTEPGFLKEYRNAVKLLNESTRRIWARDTRFENLDPGGRERVVESILWRYSADDKWTILLEKLVVSKRRLAFRWFVVRDLLSAFYRSSAGWKVVGYTKYPGVPEKDQFEYTRPLEG